MAVYKFGEHDIYLPLAVIDDLDDIKTRPGNIAWSAREVFRILDKLDLKTLVDKGIQINDSKGRLFIHNTEAPLTKNEAPNIVRVNSDNAIINTAISLKNKFPNRPVTIITKDTGLRVRANAWGCNAENYKADLLDQDIYTGIINIEIDDQEEWHSLWSDDELQISKLSENLQNKLININPNEFVIFNYGTNKCPAYYKNGYLRVLKEKSKDQKMAYSSITSKNLEQRMALEALNDHSVPLVTLVGAAGTGKSFLAIASALQAINAGTYDRMVVMKPLIPVGGKDIGALPGDKFEKISAWLGPVKDNIDQILGSGSLSANDKFEEMVKEGLIEVEAMAFIQGRSIANSVIILDECLVPGTMIYMADGSVKKIENVNDGDEVISFDVEDQTWTKNKVCNKFSRLTENLVEINTSKGYLKCTPSHQMWVYENGTKLIKKEARMLNLSDLIPVANKFTHQELNELDESEAGLLALILCDGHIEKNLYSIKVDFSKDQEWLKHTFVKFTQNFANTKVGIKNKRNNMICKITNKSEIINFINKHNLKPGNKSNFIEVPDMIWNAPLKSIKKFIQICFDCEGDVNIEERTGVSKAVVSFASTSSNFVYQLQALLLKFEIDSHIYVCNKKYGNKPSYRLSIVGGYMCNKFANIIGFSIDRKQNSLFSIKDETFPCPYIYPKACVVDVYNELENDGRWKDKSIYTKGDLNNDIGRISHNKGPAISQSTLNKFLPIANKNNFNLNDIVVCAKINKIKTLEQTTEVYDFTVENTHTFVANGMLSSNCQNITPREARMVVERCGKNSKVILLGDPSQVENSYLDARSNGLAHAVMGGIKMKECATVTLTKVERSLLAAVASNIFNSPEAKR